MRSLILQQLIRELKKFKILLHFIYFNYIANTKTQLCNQNEDFKYFQFNTNKCFYCTYSPIVWMLFSFIHIHSIINNN